MDFSFTEEQEKFRKEVRDFLDEELRKGGLGKVWMPGFSKRVLTGLLGADAHKPLTTG